MEIEEEKKMKKMIEEVKKDVRDSIKVRKNMTKENLRYLKDEADFVKETTKKFKAEFTERGDKYTLEIYKPKVMKEIICFNSIKNSIQMKERAQSSSTEHTRLKNIKRSWENNLDSYLVKNYHKLLYEKQKLDTEKAKEQEMIRTQNINNQNMSKIQAAKFYSLNSTKTFKRKQLLTNESIKHKEVKSPKQECNI